MRYFTQDEQGKTLVIVDKLDALLFYKHHAQYPRWRKKMPHSDPYDAWFMGTKIGDGSTRVWGERDVDEKELFTKILKGEVGRFAFDA